MQKGILAVALLLVGGACGGGGSSSSASVNGTIDGQSMGAQDAVSNVITSGSDSEGGILITNSANTCAKLSASQQPRNAKAILIAIGTQSASGVSAPAATGAYVVYSSATIGGATGKAATALYAATDANCVPTSSIEATTGTVTLTRIDSNGYSGTFDLTFSGTAGHVTGSFSANRCAALSMNIGGTCT